jgi:ribonuclease BN (tRNA processing enzyme)
MEVSFLGAHNTESKKTRLTTLLVDGIMALDAAAITRGLTFNDQKKVKAILITHHHYDHIRDIPALAMNLYLSGRTLDVYALEPAIAAVKTYLLNEDLYPKFYQRPPGNPVIKFITVVPGQARQIEGYSVLPLTVNHPVPAVGYEIKSAGKTLFYTGDTGKGLAKVWQRVSPHLLIIELTAPNKYEAAVGDGSKHLTPRLLQEELESFRRIKGYIPRVLLVHMSPFEERFIKMEIAAVARSLKTDIALAKEGMKVTL